MRLIVIGGGAAGFFCAVNAAIMNPSLQVKIVEKSSKVLSKVRISGGGRCNVTHACFSVPEIVKKYPRGANFVKKSFHEFFVPDTIKWFASRGVQLKTEVDGRMFPVTDTSSTIINCLVAEARSHNVAVKLNHDVKDISENHGKWIIRYADGSEETAEYLCIASGGFPKISMFDWLKNTGHTIIPPVPSLFTFNIPDNDITSLMGIAVDAKVKIAGSNYVEEGPVLITHWGVSGPAVLKLSARAARELNEKNYSFHVMVNWCDMNEQGVRERIALMRSEHGSQKVTNGNFAGLPKRMWEYLCDQSQISEQIRWADLPAVKQNALIRYMCAHDLPVHGKTTYKEEFVTSGGISLSEVEPSTMRSRLHKNLYFAGEILDVDGVTGGFNFQHAWTSGWIAARSVATLGNLR